MQLFHERDDIMLVVCAKFVRACERLYFENQRSPGSHDFFECININRVINESFVNHITPVTV